MPEKLERELKREAKKKFPKDEERQNAYVYGTLRKLGWRPTREHKRALKGSKPFTPTELLRGYRKGGR